MIKTPTKLITFEEYLKYDDDKRYELVDGELVEMALGRGKHADIIDFLNDNFKLEIKRLGKDWISRHSSIGVKLPSISEKVTSRIPDISVVTNAQWQNLQEQSAVLVDSAPLLVVEVVSEGSKTVDHRRKRAEYNILNIPEYWIVDFLTDDPKYPPGVTVLTLVEGLYEESFFKDNDQIISTIFTELNLTVQQVLQAL
ncbi:MAG TPA: Uma2 family endonuclease [Nostocaceae cyanobacterium]|nr:Uma2 family endonuclease [Nostocaceae cyanobacterium]